MLNGKALNATNAKVYINGFWVDDFYSVQYANNNMKVPFRGYHQKHWSMVADGNVIVAGNLVLNFRHPGYLFRAIASTMPNVVVRTATTIHNSQVRELMNMIRKSTPRERVELLAAAPPGAFNIMSELLEATFAAPAGELETSNPVELGPDDSWSGASGFNLDIVYGDEANAFVERFVNVHLTQQSKDITNSAAQGAESLLDAYQFFAQKIRVDMRRSAIGVQIGEAGEVKLSDLNVS